MQKKLQRILLLHSLPTSSHLSDPDFRIAPIGLFFIAGALKKNGFQPRILSILSSAFNNDAPSLQDYASQLKAEIIDFKADIIGYSFRNLYNLGLPVKQTNTLYDFFSASQDLPIIQFLRTISNAPIIGGGSAFSLAPEFYMTYLELDFGIQGEGENAFVMLLNAIEKNCPDTSIPGLVYKQGKDIYINDNDFNVNTSSNIDLSSLKENRDLYYDNGGYGSIQTKRGCSFNCSYCVYPYLEGKKYRLRSIPQIIMEIEEYIHNYQIDHIYFVDSVFSTPTDHSLSLVQNIIQKRLQFSWYGYVNPSGLTYEILKDYKESGCAGLVLTLDSGSEKILKKLNKGFTIQESIQAIENLDKTGIQFEVSMLVGSPGETEETLYETLLFSSNYLKAVPTIFTPGVWMHPDSPVYATYHNTRDPDQDTLSNLLLQNDFTSHNALHYFFSDHKNRLELIQRFYAMADQEPIWFILGKDIVPDVHSGIMRFRNVQHYKRYCRPWYAGLSL